MMTACKLYLPSLSELVENFNIVYAELVSDRWQLQSVKIFTLVFEKLNKIVISKTQLSFDNS
jgi:hypothetical protein